MNVKNIEVSNPRLRGKMSVFKLEKYVTEGDCYLAPQTMGGNKSFGQSCIKYLEKLQFSSSIRSMKSFFNL